MVIKKEYVILYLIGYIFYYSLCLYVLVGGLTRLTDSGL